MTYRRLSIVGMGVIVLALIITGWYYAHTNAPKDNRTKAQQAHGVQLPASARDVQYLEVGRGTDRTVLTLFGMRESEVDMFINQLIVNQNIKATHANTFGMSSEQDAGSGEQWEQKRQQLSMGNTTDPFIGPIDRGFVKTWNGRAVPVELLICTSPSGDILIIKIHQVDQEILVEMRTDWD